MYFVGDDHMVPFVSLAAADNEYDRVSNLDREGVYRVNIGVTRKTFAALLFGDRPTDDIDYARAERVYAAPAPTPSRILSAFSIRQARMKR